jgi:hypothetical protein
LLSDPNDNTLSNHTGTTGATFFARRALRFSTAVYTRAHSTTWLGVSMKGIWWRKRNRSPLRIGECGNFMCLRHRTLHRVEVRAMIYFETMESSISQQNVLLMRNSVADKWGIGVLSMTRVGFVVRVGNC